MFRANLHHALVGNEQQNRAADMAALGIIQVSWRLKETEGREKRKKKMAENRKETSTKPGKMELLLFWALYSFLHPDIMNHCHWKIHSKPELRPVRAAALQTFGKVPFGLGTAAAVSLYGASTSLPQIRGMETRT